MKKALSLILLLLLAASVFAEKDVTRFLGIPVDGCKAEMLQKIKAKGFRSSPVDKDILEGEFNGYNVNIHVVTNGNRVYRVMVCDATPVDERSIQIRFNRLCEQFENNPKYINLGNDRIPDDEDIRYEIAIHKKRYEAAYLQYPDTATYNEVFIEKGMPRLLEKYSPEQFQNPTEDMKNDVIKASNELVKEISAKKLVWFTISDYLGKYYITMFYDNEYNQANGEDL